MAYRRKKRFLNPDKYYSVVNKFRREGRSTEEFEIMLQSFNLEELIALKLELSAKATDGKLFGYNFWSKLPEITRYAMLIFAYNSAHSMREAADLLGIPVREYKRLVKRYEIADFFEKNNDEELD